MEDEIKRLAKKYGKEEDLIQLAYDILKDLGYSHEKIIKRIDEFYKMKAGVAK